MNFECKNPALIGKPISVGDHLVFKAVDKHMEDFDSSKINKKWKVISVVPSLDTGVCAKQTRRFNELVTGLPDAMVITISMDLPFAQERFCGAEGLENIVVVSDYKYSDFGKKTNLFIKSAMLLTRAVILLDENNKVAYIEICAILDNEPVYSKVINYIKEH